MDQGLVEYGLILVSISVVISPILFNLGGSITGNFDGVVGDLGFESEEVTDGEGVVESEGNLFTYTHHDDGAHTTITGLIEKGVSLGLI